MALRYTCDTYIADNARALARTKKRNASSKQRVKRETRLFAYFNASGTNLSPKKQHGLDETLVAPTALGNTGETEREGPNIREEVIRAPHSHPGRDRAKGSLGEPACTPAFDDASSFPRSEEDAPIKRFTTRHEQLGAHSWRKVSRGQDEAAAREPIESLKISSKTTS
ncbi:hypothetical protein HPB48_025499 [Haemaphysalis longicornis]|uniref:Uncharacterized protein n=1 Tax=Haemaphysalis longicornis TaxID=44386 RepID=A0A9J6HAF3_HAELO|nr:hypothetical protein HPB48_025499 [Haemaphysalis longicornis]